MALFFYLWHENNMSHWKANPSMHCSWTFSLKNKSTGVAFFFFLNQELKSWNLHIAQARRCLFRELEHAELWFYSIVYFFSFKSSWNLNFSHKPCISYISRSWSFFFFFFWLYPMLEAHFLDCKTLWKEWVNIEASWGKHRRTSSLHRTPNPTPPPPISNITHL